jgi:hypothetical protein
MNPPKIFTSVSQQLARQMAAAAERGADNVERDAADRDAKREAQYIKERKRRSGDVVGKIFRRVDHADGSVHVGFVASRAGSDRVLVRLLDPVTGVPVIDGSVLVRLDSLCVDFGDGHVSVTFYEDAVSYVAALRCHPRNDDMTLPAKSGVDPAEVSSGKR